MVLKDQADGHGPAHPGLALGGAYGSGPGGDQTAGSRIHAQGARMRKDGIGQIGARLIQDQVDRQGCADPGPPAVRQRTSDGNQHGIVASRQGQRPADAAAGHQAIDNGFGDILDDIDGNRTGDGNALFLGSACPAGRQGDQVTAAGGSHDHSAGSAGLLDLAVFNDRAGAALQPV